MDSTLYKRPGNDWGHKKQADASAVFSTAIALALLVTFLGGASLMLLAAALHAVIAAVPAIGYFSAAGIVLFTRLTVKFVTL